MDEDRLFVATHGKAKKMRQLALESGLARRMVEETSKERERKKKDEERIRKLHEDQYEETLRLIEEYAKKLGTDIIVGKLYPEVEARLKSDGFHIHGYDFDSRSRIWW